MTHARLVRSAVLTAGLAVARLALAQPFTLTSPDIKPNALIAENGRSRSFEHLDG